MIWSFSINVNIGTSNSVVEIDWLLSAECSQYLANAKRPCDCSVLYLRPKSSLCSCLHCILDMTSFGSTVRCREEGRDSVQQRVDQFKPIFQVEGNTFRLIFSLYS